jgi:hypothetical protein
MLEFGVSEIFKSEGGTYKEEDLDEILKREEEKEIKRNKELEEYFEKHKNLLDLDEGAGKFNTLFFENQDYSRKEENSKTLEEIKKKKKENQAKSKINFDY